MENPDQLFLLVVKVFCMVVMFLIIMITGSIPYKSEGFKSNPKLMSLSSAFSGGLFIAVGMIHLLPEAVEKFETFCEEKGIPFKPFPQATILLSFSIFLFIEKLAFNGVHQRASIIEDQQEQKKQEQANKQSLTPYILQVAIGLHAVFEGLAIGIEEHKSDCVGIGILIELYCISCGSFMPQMGIEQTSQVNLQAEGLTLGVAFKKAGTEQHQALCMIIIQALMNPIGVLIGMFFSSSGLLTTSIFVSISAGTFIYIAAIEVIHEEFSIRRFQRQKFIFYVTGILFVCLIHFIEHALE